MTDLVNNTNFFVDSLALNVTVCKVALFADGFESGDTSDWSDAVPAPPVAIPRRR